jgi:hypothetical protein
MSHPAQRKFCREIRRKFRSHFINSNIIDCGSLDINGNNRWLFRRNLFNWYGINSYIGIDIQLGANVDILGHTHDVLPRIMKLPMAFMIEKKDKPIWPIEVVISTEMLEHDKHWAASIRAMYDILKPGGLLLITAGGDGRMEHGTYMSVPVDSPATLDYYRNMSNEMFESILPRKLFSEYIIRQTNGDFQFAGIKALV